MHFPPCRWRDGNGRRQGGKVVKCIERPLESDRKMVIESGINFHRRMRIAKGHFACFSVSNYHNAAHDYRREWRKESEKEESRNLIVGEHWKGCINYLAISIRFSPSRLTPFFSCAVIYFHTLRNQCRDSTLRAFRMFVLVLWIRFQDSYVSLGLMGIVWVTLQVIFKDIFQQIKVIAFVWRKFLWIAAEFKGNQVAFEGSCL